MNTGRAAIALGALALAVACGQGELSRSRAQKLLEASPAFKEVLSSRPDVARKVQAITGVRNEGKRAFADVEFKWVGDVPSELLTAKRTATALFSLYDDGWRYTGLIDEQSTTETDDAAWVIQEHYAEKGRAK